jgi:3-oxoadipate enol-lactonase
VPTVHVKGLEMYYEAAGKGEPVILIMGLGGDHTAWGLQVPDLVAAGYQCIAFDNRDVGQTAESPVPAYSIRDMAEDTAGCMEALGLDCAHIVGASMGGMIAQELALAHPERVGTLTLACSEPHVDPYLRIILQSFGAWRRRLDKEDLARSQSVWVLTHAYLADEKNFRAFMNLMFDNPHPQSDASYLRQLGACLGHDALERLGQIRAPTLVLVGSEDILTPLRLAKLMVERIPHAKLVVIPGGPHGFLWENAPEFNRSIIAFLKGHPLGVTPPPPNERG